MYKNVPLASPWRMPLTKDAASEFVKLVIAIPILIPSGDMKAKVRLDLIMDGKVSLLCTKFKPRLKAKMHLCKTKATNICRTWCVSACSPTANPSNTECNDKAVSRMKDLITEWAFGSSAGLCAVSSSASISSIVSPNSFVLPSKVDRSELSDLSKSSSGLKGSAFVPSFVFPEMGGFSFIISTTCSTSKITNNPYVSRNSGTGNGVDILASSNTFAICSFTSGNKSRRQVPRNTPAAKQLSKLMAHLYFRLPWKVPEPNTSNKISVKWQVFCKRSEILPLQDLCFDSPFGQTYKRMRLRSRIVHLHRRPSKRCSVANREHHSAAHFNLRVTQPRGWTVIGFMTCRLRKVCLLRQAVPRIQGMCTKFRPSCLHSCLRSVERDKRNWWVNVDVDTNATDMTNETLYKYLVHLATGKCSLWAPPPPHTNTHRSDTHT